MDYKTWAVQFEAAYLRRTGITVAEGGVSAEEMEAYHEKGQSPEWAVSAEISKYGLADHDPPMPF